MTEVTTQQLTKSIKDILKDADLDTLSSKKVRKMLEASFNADLTERKEEIDKLLMQLITENESEGEEVATEVKQKTTNGTSQPTKMSATPKKEPPKEKVKNETSISDDEDGTQDDDDDSGADDDSDIGEPEDVVPKKKAKLQEPSKNKNKSSKKVDDEELAKQLQEDEGLRPSRRCKAQPVVRKPKKPRKEGKKGTSVYSRPCALLPPLDGLFDTDRMPRPMIVKRIWEIVKERDLLDPKNKQFMLCDEQMLGIFGRPRVRMFGVMKLLKPYIKDLQG